ncbi:transcriptional regulator, LacI family [Beutenbergia cavernae DSM 12333]|uniref:Transcriptional regulator, LacI family n=1 Tax=Beutenbergia cavernae (strain ATCC BAA-8 / DSM 12333 / CCUG 43141 / JCM 11478 / NBRC 16432 / NCIMB 13614 / HKI 0122) TaxID=471853 RepID=C5BY68_BEUC1|nr:LacI family DNA-binding transcriptional regulator [Beutenbergia cavernae]ACQ80968.1 transcriptional regulator, LacI family [Beutenbergia cavernae DSM 12333]
MTARRERPPRQADVARLAGVSQSAVSRVVSGDLARIPAATQDRIRLAVRELGYVPNPAARSLRRRRNSLLGVHTFEPVFSRARDGFYVDFLLGIEERAEESGNDLVIFTSAAGGDGSRSVYRSGVNRLGIADGSILLGVATDAHELARLAAEGYPFVHIGRREVPGAQIPCVVPDYRAAAAEVVGHLVELGHRHFAYLRDHHGMPPYDDRRSGYAAALSAHRLRDVSPGAQGRAGITDEWIDRIADGPTTAVVAESVWLADRLVAGLAARGLSVPRDVSVAVLETREPDSAIAWDCLVIPREEIGRIAVDRLIDIFEDPGQDASMTWVPCSMAPGDTIAAALQKERT